MCRNNIWYCLIFKKIYIAKINWHNLKRLHSCPYFSKFFDAQKNPWYTICSTDFEFDYQMFDYIYKFYIYYGVHVETLLTVKQPLIGRICHLFLTACCMLLLVLTFPVSGWFCFRVRNYTLTNIPDNSFHNHSTNVFGRENSVTG